MPDGPKIVVDHASKHFLEGSVVAFRNVDLNVRNNEVLCIVGPSGCGKTTLLRCIIGAERPDGGSVAFSPPNVRLGYLAQGLEYARDDTLGDL